MMCRVCHYCGVEIEKDYFGPCYDCGFELRRKNYATIASDFIGFDAPDDLPDSD